MKHSIVIAALLSLALANPITKRVPAPDSCQCTTVNDICVASFPQSCECKLTNANQCFAAQVEGGNVCPPPTFETLGDACKDHLINELKVGEKGDGCNAFTNPPQAPCGPGLTCVEEDQTVADLGGTCEPIVQEGSTCKIGEGIEDICAPYFECERLEAQTPCFDPNEPCPEVGKCKAVVEEGTACKIGEGEGIEDICAPLFECVALEGQSPCINPDEPCPQKGKCQAVVEEGTPCVIGGEDVCGPRLTCGLYEGGPVCDGDEANCPGECQTIT